jgi:ketosteroid isomerase-like protein
MKAQYYFAFAFLFLFSGFATAQDKKDDKKPEEKKKDEAAEHPEHKELRAVKIAMEDAFNKKDIDGLLKHVHKNAVVTWQNAEVSRGHKGIKEYYDRMLTGDTSVLSKVEAKPELEELSILYGEPPTTAIAYGKLKDEYKLRDGTLIKMDSRFSATLVKEEGKWLIVNFHGSTNVFGNAVMDTAIKKTMWMTAGAVGLAALLIGLIIGRVMGGKKA